MKQVNVKDAWKLKCRALRMYRLSVRFFTVDGFVYMDWSKNHV